MGCIDVRIPEIAQLIEESGLTPLTVQVKLDEWFDKYGMDAELPTIEQLYQYIVESIPSPDLTAEELIQAVAEPTPEQAEQIIKCR